MHHHYPFLGHISMHHHYPFHGHMQMELKQLELELEGVVEWKEAQGLLEVLGCCLS